MKTSDADDFDHSFPVRLNCGIFAHETPEGSFVVSLRIEADVSEGGVSGAGTFSTFSIPLSYFPNKEARAEWLELAFLNFKLSLVSLMADEARLRFNDVANLFLARSGFDPEPVTEKFLIESHLKETEARLRRLLGRGLKSQWNKRELEQAIQGAFAQLPKPLRTYSKVASHLKNTHKHKRILTPAALKQLVSRLGVEWMGLKRNTPSLP